MLEEIHVRDLALIEDVWLEFGPGMTVLTGETGAGKTALLGALKLLLGERADSSAVRSGASEALVEGRFAVGAGEVVARRRVSADGRSKCFLDGEMATVGSLAEKVGPLVDLHGQHEHQALLSTATHAGYLDAWIGEPAVDALDAYRLARARYRAALAALDELESRLAADARDADYLRFVIEEIDRVAPVPGEDDELEARLPALRHGEALAQAASEAASSLRSDGGATDAIGRARSALRRVAGIDPALDELDLRLAEIETLADDVGIAMRDYRDSVEHDPRVLDETMSRLASLGGLTRKYGPTLGDVIGRRTEAARSLERVDDREGETARARDELGAAEVEFRAAGATCAALRVGAAEGFSAALADAAAELAMSGSRFEVHVGELPFDSWGAEGPVRVEFLYAPGPGLPAKPLARIASGGEISRVMLALKSVLGSADSVETLVFDEVDAGIGGATAHAVGRRLAQLARSHQVIVVTHLAQVAAYADAHLVVSKEVTQAGAHTTVTVVEGEGRVEEVARMLSGDGSETSLAHARELLGGVDVPVTAG